MATVGTVYSIAVFPSMHGELSENFKELFLRFTKRVLFLLDVFTHVYPYILYLLFQNVFYYVKIFLLSINKLSCL